ncbi:MAG: hypothetical protein ABI759_08985 [Candidatus Solibacter sp.]
METIAKLFRRFLVFVDHCFGRIVIQGYLPLLTRPEHIVHFFRDVHGQYPITPQVRAMRTLEYRGWVDGPHLQRQDRHGVYCIFTSMEMGSTFKFKDYRR